MKSLKILILIAVFTLSFVACEKDEATLPGVGFEIKLSNNPLSLPQKGGESIIMGINKTRQWIVFEEFGFKINGIRIKNLKDENITIKRTSQKMYGDAIMAITEISGEWFEIKIARPNITVKIAENTTGKSREFSFGLTDLGNGGQLVKIKQQ